MADTDNTEFHEEKVIQLDKLYAFSPDDMEINISSVGYSNLAYIQVSPRDVIIDFLEMPGINANGKRVVNGRRIFMSHFAAQKLAKELDRVLRRVHKAKVMESYQPSQKEE